MDYEKYHNSAEVLKAIAHPVRLCILRNILEHQDSGDRLTNVASIQTCVNIPQSTLSQHLGKLRQAGVVISKRHGLEMAYEVVDPRIRSIIKLMLE